MAAVLSKPVCGPRWLRDLLRRPAQLLQRRLRYPEYSFSLADPADAHRRRAYAPRRYSQPLPRPVSHRRTALYAAFLPGAFSVDRRSEYGHQHGGTKLLSGWLDAIAG